MSFQDTDHVKRSVTIAGHRTSISLEPEFWDALKYLACEEKLSVNRLVAVIDAERAAQDESSAASLPSLSSAIRVHLLNHFRNQHSAD
jgi:predicted DNA-binding ribbon-helix-helix protein